MTYVLQRMEIDSGKIEEPTRVGKHKALLVREMSQYSVQSKEVTISSHIFYHEKETQCPANWIVEAEQSVYSALTHRQN